MATTDHIVMPEDHMEQLYRSKNPLVRFVHGGRLRAVVQNMPRREHLAVLDAGCGEGQLIEQMYRSDQSHEYHGVDITPIAIKKAKARCPYAQLKVGDLAQLPYRDEFFDVVVCSEVLEHIPEYATVINELKRVLKKGGNLIISFPNEPLWICSRFLLGRKPVKVPDHVNSFTPRMIRKAVNLRIIRKQYLPFDFPFFLSLIGLQVFRK